MKKKWESKKIYEHPVKHQAGQFGKIVLSDADIYVFAQGSVKMSCPQGWATKMHAQELAEADASGNGVGRPQVGDRTLAAIVVPDEIRTSLEAVAERLGLSLPDARREAYRMFLNANKEV